MPTESTLRYIKLDYQAQKDALLQRIRERYPSTWNDFLANSFGIVLVDIVAWGLATLTYTINFVAGENYLGTMKLRESAVRMGRLVGYRLRSSVPATVSCEATLSSSASAPILIKKGTLIRTSNDAGLPFEVARDYTIMPGSLTPETLVVTFSPSLTGSNVVNTYVSVTSGSANVDMSDSTVDLTQYVQVGQTFTAGSDATSYVIQSIESVAGAVSAYTRLVLDRPYTGSTAVVEGTVIDTRIQLVQGQTVTERYAAPAGSTAGYVIKLSRAPVIDKSVVVEINGTTWSEAESVGLTGSTDQVYQVRTMVDGTTVVIFGDGAFGALVPSETVVSVTYRIGGGLAGNAGLNTINTSFTGYNTGISSPTTVLVSNATSSGVGGQDAETLDQARVNIPFHARTNDRAVTLEDYHTLAQQYSDPNFGSVAYARASVRRNNALLEGNMVAVYAWTTSSSGGLTALTPQLKSALQDYLQRKSVGTDFVKVFDGTARPVPVSVRFKTYSGFSVSDTKSLVSDTLRSYVNTLRPGDPIYYSNLMRTLDETYGVDTVVMATPINDLYPANDLELFSAPQDTYVYALQKVSQGIPKLDGVSSVSLYTAQLPIYPVASWSFRLFLGVSELTLAPYVTAGYARVFGSSISANADASFHSTVNLLTGQVNLWIKGAPGDLSMRLVTAQGYTTDRIVNVYVGYIGTNTQSKRREIRAALRAWSDGLGVGSAMYAQQVAGIDVSGVSVADVVMSIAGVQSVTRVALGTPGSTDSRVTASDTELLRIGNCIINNSED